MYLPVVTIEEYTESETEEDCIVSELSTELVSPVVPIEEDTASEIVVDGTVSKLSTELVSPVVECEDGLLKIEGVVTSLDTSVIVIAELPPMGARLDGVFVTVVWSRA